MKKTNLPDTMTHYLKIEVINIMLPKVISVKLSIDISTRIIIQWIKY